MFSIRFLNQSIFTPAHSEIVSFFTDLSANNKSPNADEAKGDLRFLRSILLRNTLHVVTGFGVHENVIAFFHEDWHTDHHAVIDSSILEHVS